MFKQRNSIRNRANAKQANEIYNITTEKCTPIKPLLVMNNPACVQDDKKRNIIPATNQPNFCILSKALSCYEPPNVKPMTPKKHTIIAKYSAFSIGSLNI